MTEDKYDTINIEELATLPDIRRCIDDIQLSSDDINKLKVMYVAFHDKGYLKFHGKRLYLIEKGILDYSFWEIFLNSEQICYEISFIPFDLEVDRPLISREEIEIIQKIPKETIEIILLKDYLEKIYGEDSTKFDFERLYITCRNLRNFYHKPHDKNDYTPSKDILRDLIDYSFHKSVRRKYFNENSDCDCLK